MFSSVMKLLLDPSERIDRGGFLKGFGGVLALVVALVAALNVDAIEGATAGGGFVFAFFAKCCLFALLWPLSVLTIKRLRDCRVSPWWTLAHLMIPASIVVPLAWPLPSLVILIMCAVKASADRHDGVERIA